MSDHKSNEMVKIKKSSESSQNMSMASDGAHYPYGLSLSVDDDLIDELDVGGLAVGDVVEVRGFAFVDSKFESSDSEGSIKSLRLQMTALKLEREDDDRAEQLYGKGS